VGARRFSPLRVASAAAAVVATVAVGVNFVAVAASSRQLLTSCLDPSLL